jgi:glycosyltransferase involved in cell wall biosynthesis
MNILALEPSFYLGMNGSARTLYDLLKYWPEPDRLQILSPTQEPGDARYWLNECDPFKPDIVWANNEIDIKLAHEIASVCEAKLAVSLRNPSHKLDRDSAARLLEVDLFLTASEFCRQGWQADYGFAIQVIPNSVDLDKFKPGPGPYRKPDQRLVLYLGRLNKSKGIQHLVHIARELKALGSYHVAVVGRQDELPVRFKQQLTNYATDNLSIHSATDRPWDWINSANILIHPCEWTEIFGKVIIESLACGKPILASARGGIPEILSPFPELLMDTLHPREWARQIHAVVENSTADFQPDQLTDHAAQYSAALIAEQYYQAFCSLHNPE